MWPAVAEAVGYNGCVQAPASKMVLVFLCINLRRVHLTVKAWLTGAQFGIISVLQALRLPTAQLMVMSLYDQQGSTALGDQVALCQSMQRCILLHLVLN